MKFIYNMLKRMSAFVIERVKPDSSTQYWDEDGYWCLQRKDATRYTWAWAHDIIDQYKLKEANPGDCIQVIAAPAADLDTM